VIDPVASLQSALTGRYTIARPLGQGGMATVYLAHDVRHDRQVALKVLRPELAAVIGAERFLAEIKTTANLQHPHILPLFDSGAVDGTVFYVMPFVVGESLRDRLTREKQLPLPEAVRIATEVASALDYAHRHGVIHRDIKPENILLHDGQALVADFGIALAVATTGGTRMTETGMSLGTPTYMSPEQAMGERTLDARTDVYALGCVLYEMLSGDPPFQGSSAQAILAKVMTEKPAAIRSFRDTVPEPLEDAVLIALAKLPADRFPSAAAFAEALRNPETTVRGKPVLQSRRRGARAGRLIAPLTAVAAIAVAAWALLRSPAEPPVSRYPLVVPVSRGPNLGAAIAPDDSRLVYLGPGGSGLTQGGGNQLWVKSRDRAEAVPVPGTNGAVSFAISPDGKSVAWANGFPGTLFITPTGGGPSVTAANQVGCGHTWLADGSLIYSDETATGLWRTSPTGGQPTEVLRMDSSYSACRPVGLPDARGVLFSRYFEGNKNEELWGLDLQSGASKRLLVGVSRAEYLATGHLLYGTGEGTLSVVGFDLTSFEVRGPPVPVMEGVAFGLFGTPQFSVSARGTLVTQMQDRRSSEYQAVWVDRQGRESLVDPTWIFRPIVWGSNVGWALSPDGSALAIGLASQDYQDYSLTSDGSVIWMKRLPAGPLARLTFDSGPTTRPRWTADGRTVVYVVGIDGVRQRRADGSGSDSVLYRGSAASEAAWSTDRRWLLVRQFAAGGTGGRDILGFRPGIDSALRPLVATKYDESALALSPDDRWLAYESNETGQTDVFLRPFPNTEAAKWQVSVAGGFAPLWARNGRELFYMTPVRDMMAVSVTPGPTPGLGTPRKLFRLSDDFWGGSPEFYTPYDVAPDGRFLMAKRVGGAAGSTTSLVVAEHWFSELARLLKKRRAP